MPLKTGAFVRCAVYYLFVCEYVHIAHVKSAVQIAEAAVSEWFRVPQTTFVVFQQLESAQTAARADRQCGRNEWKHSCAECANRHGWERNSVEIGCIAQLQSSKKGKHVPSIIIVISDCHHLGVFLHCFCWHSPWWWVGDRRHLGMTGSWMWRHAPARDLLFCTSWTFKSWLPFGIEALIRRRISPTIS